MPSFYDYNPEQAYLLPPSVRDVLGENHLCFFVSGVVERLELSEFERGYSEAGHPAYHPLLMLKVWLYAYALGVTSARRLEQRIREDLAFRYLAGSATPDFWAWNEFRKRHGRAINQVFTQVVETARAAGMGRLGHVAIDSTRVAANAAADSTETIARLRAERAKIRPEVRRWQQRCAADDPNEAPGTELGAEQMQRFQERLAEIPRRMERLQKAGVQRLSRTDEQSRFLRERKGFVLGYTATVAVSEDHLIVAQQVNQETTDHGLLLPLVQSVERECGERPQRVLADSGFFTIANVRQMAAVGIDAYVPDSNSARELNGRGRGGFHGRARDAVHRRLRAKLRSAAGRAVYGRRKAIVEPVFGVLKQQRGMRQFRRRGLARVAVEFSLAAIAYNLTRLWKQRAA
jgi:transposase